MGSTGEGVRPFLAALTSGSNPTDSRATIILDGALATELERVNPSSALNTPLWSGQTLLTNPERIQAVHASYFLAGANVAITASYQASTRGLVQHGKMSEAQALRVVARSVEAAAAARDDVSASSSPNSACSLLVAGSVGPYGAYLSDGSEYTGEYGAIQASAAQFREEMKVFHLPRITALVEAGADVLAIETQPCLVEIEALVELLRDEFPETLSWISCTVRWNEEGNVVLSDGSSLKQVCEAGEGSEQIIAVGVNCCPKGIVTPALREVKKWTQKPLVAYPNSGEEWDAVSKTWGKPEADERSWREHVSEWRAEGARLIGGCCRTTPDDIQKIKECCEAN